MKTVGCTVSNEAAAHWGCISNVEQDMQWLDLIHTGQDNVQNSYNRVTHQSLIWAVIGEEDRVDIPICKQAV